MKLWVALVPLLIPAVAAAEDWVRVETQNLVVFGQAGEKRTREVTAEFERFRQAITQVLPGATIDSAVPTTVVVFENQRAFAPFRPRYNGKPVAVSGFFTATESDNMIAFPYDDRENGLRIIFHEYTHLITANASRALPAWVGEGLAEFYSTFEVEPDGKAARLGRIIPSHYQVLGQNRLLPLEQLLTVDHSSALYNEGQRRSIFYAQSWAMVHMFMTGEPSRSKEFSEYVRLCAGGVAPLDAWQRAFGDFDVNRELTRYLSQFAVRNYLFKFPEGMGPLKADVSEPRAADVEAVLGQLMRYAAGDEVEPRLRRAADMTPSSMLPRALLGFSLVRSGQSEAGTTLLVEAAAHKRDWLVQYYVAAGLAHVARSGSTPDDRLLAMAGDAVETVISARPALANAFALKAEIVRGAEGAASAAKARALAPGREDYAFLEAQLRADLRDFPAARTVLAPLMSSRFPPEVRTAARTVMGQIVRMEEFYAKRAAARTETTASADGPASGLAAGATPLYRLVKRGEERIEGMLERLECGRDGAVTVVLRVGSETKRFTAAVFSDIDFITYRDDLTGSVVCGERKPPDHVYVTWLPLGAPVSGVTGKPVAVEFLPVK